MRTPWATSDACILVLIQPLKSKKSPLVNPSVPCTRRQCIAMRFRSRSNAPTAQALERLGHVKYRPECPVDAPHQKKVDLALTREIQEIAPGGTPQEVGSRRLIDKLTDHRVALVFTELSQWYELRLRVLFLFYGGDPRIYTDPHWTTPRRKRVVL